MTSTYVGPRKDCWHSGTPRMYQLPPAGWPRCSLCGRMTPMEIGELHGHTVWSHPVPAMELMPPFEAAVRWLARRLGRKLVRP